MFIYFIWIEREVFILWIWISLMPPLDFFVIYPNGKLEMFIGILTNLIIIGLLLQYFIMHSLFSQIKKLWSGIYEKWKIMSFSLVCRRINEQSVICIGVFFILKLLLHVPMIVTFIYGTWEWILLDQQAHCVHGQVCLCKFIPSGCQSHDVESIKWIQVGNFSWLWFTSLGHSGNIFWNLFERKDLLPFH